MCAPTARLRWYALFMSRWQLEFVSGRRLDLRPGVTVVGRSGDCDVVLDNPAVSRRQLLLHARSDGVELVNLGRAKVSCAGREVTEGLLATGDELLNIGDSPFATLRANATRASEQRWLVRVDSDPSTSLRPPFRAGAGDELDIASWPPALLLFHAVADTLVVELGAAGEASERKRFGDDGLLELREGHFELRGHRFEVAAAQRVGVQTTQRRGPSTGARITIEPHRQGGVITIERGGEPRSVYLAGRRFALVRALLDPPEPLQPGAFVTLGALIEAVWPDSGDKDDSDLNVLIYRVRRDLTRAELEPSAFIERERGRVRAPIARGASIVQAG